MERQKFSSCPIFFDEPFTRGLTVNGPPSFAEPPPLIYTCSVYLCETFRAPLFHRTFGPLIVADFFGFMPLYCESNDGLYDCLYRLYDEQDNDNNDDEANDVVQKQ